MGCLEIFWAKNTAVRPCQLVKGLKGVICPLRILPWGNTPNNFATFKIVYNLISNVLKNVFLHKECAANAHENIQNFVPTPLPLRPPPHIKNLVYAPMENLSSQVLKVLDGVFLLYPNNNSRSRFSFSFLFFSIFSPHSFSFFLFTFSC